MKHLSPLRAGATEKSCSKCRKVKPLSEFYPRREKNTRGYASQCKDCEDNRRRARRMDPSYLEYHLKYGRAWRDANRERSNAYTDAWRARNPRRLSMLKRKWRYGLSEDAFTELLEAQDFRCAICARPFDPEGGIHTIHVDHDHSTNEVRGLLCGDCNRGIGLFMDSPEHLLAAVDYLVSKRTNVTKSNDPSYHDAIVENKSQSTKP